MDIKELNKLVAISSRLPCLKNHCKLNKSSSPYGFHILLVPYSVAVHNVPYFVLVCGVIWKHGHCISHKSLLNIYFQPSIKYNLEVELAHPSYVTNGATSYLLFHCSWIQQPHFLSHCELHQPTPLSVSSRIKNYEREWQGQSSPVHYCSNL
jgi:hypothetical protein